LEPLDIRSTSQHSAVGSDIVIRQTDLVRLVFRPEIVDNPTNPRAAIRGTFLYQKKGKVDQWSDADHASLGTIKKGEGFQIEIKSGELLPLLRALGALYRLHAREGVPQGRQRFVKMEENLGKLLELGDADLNDFLTAHTADAVTTLRRVLRWLTTSTALADFIDADGGQVAVINAALGLANLRNVHRVWTENETNSSEPFWQQLLSRHAFVLSQVFSYPIIVLREKAYLGGKRIDNQHGNVADFLARAATSGNPVIIEIKTPTTPLLGAEYRDEAYPLSAELSGAIAQVLKYRDSLSEHVRQLMAEHDRRVLATEARCLLIAGHTSSLISTDRRLSFERFRERLAGVTIVTYDELFARVQELARLFETDAS
jgi:hypothetical protein